MQSDSGYLRGSGLNLFVHRFRDPTVPASGLTLLLLHGIFDAGATWDLVAPLLARQGHDVIAPDLRGFGRSDWVGAGGYYHFPDYVADIAALVDTLAPRRLGIIGHSMGGTVAVYFTGARPKEVERLALLEGLGPLGTEPSQAVDRLNAWLRGLRETPRTPKPLHSLQEAIERLALHHPRVDRALLESRARLLTKTDEQGRLSWSYDPLHRTISPSPFQLPAFRGFLSKVGCPTLLVDGGPLGYHVPDEAERIACLPNARRVEIPDAGHMMHWTAPALLAEHLTDFFGEPAPSS